MLAASVECRLLSLLYIQYFFSSEFMVSLRFNVSYRRCCCASQHTVVTDYLKPVCTMETVLRAIIDTVVAIILPRHIILNLI